MIDCTDILKKDAHIKKDIENKLIFLNVIQFDVYYTILTFNFICYIVVYSLVSIVQCKHGNLACFLFGTCAAGL